MIALPVLMIVAGAVLKWALGNASNGLTDVVGLLMIAIGTVWLATFVVTGRYWHRREQSLPDSTRV